MRRIQSMKEDPVKMYNGFLSTIHPQMGPDLLGQALGPVRR
jgi:hypothetical protein